MSGPFLANAHTLGAEATKQHPKFLVSFKSPKFSSPNADVVSQDDRVYHRVYCRGFPLCVIGT